MELTLSIHSVAEAHFDHTTRLDGTTLIVDREELRRLALADASLASIDFEIVHPGESCRAGPVFDIIEPRAKAPESGADFPGALGPPVSAGMGTTHVLKGVAVTILRERPPGDSRGETGYVLAMSGTAAAASPYGMLCHLIVIPHTDRGLSEHARQRAYRMAGLKIAVYLARAGLEHAASTIHQFEAVGPAEQGASGLPRVAYVGQIFSRQRKPEPGEQILYGTDTDGMLPVLLHPDEWLDGAVLPSYHTSLGGAETYFYQNHPVITELYRRHQTRHLQFVGTVATIASADNFDRERNCRFASNLVRSVLKADAAVLTKFGGGVPHTDLSETARLLERMGVRTAVQVTDLARDQRVESALLFNFPEVDAIVCIGGNDGPWKIPPVKRAIAADPQTAEVLRGAVELPALNVVGVANQQGASRLRAMVY